jgi:hypothetical protein
MLATLVLAVALSSSMEVLAPIGLERAEVDSVLQAALPELQRCNGAGAAGTVVFDLSVNDAGVVSEVARERRFFSSTHLDGVAACLSTQLAWLRFGPSAPEFPAAPGPVGMEVRVRVDVGVEMAVRTTTFATSSGPTVVFDPQGVAPGVVQAVAMQNTALLDCYRRALHEDPQAAGVLVVQHTVDGDGVIIDEALLPTSAMRIARVPLFSTCVRAVLRTLPYPEQATIVALPLAFQRPPSLSDLEQTTRTLRRPLRACHVRPGARIGVAFTVDDTGRATTVDLTTPADAVLNDVDATCVRSVVEATSWPHFGAARISTVLLDERLEPTIDAVFAEQMTRLMTCYGDALSRDSRLAGTLTLRIVADADGLVVDVDGLDPAPGVLALTEPSMFACAVRNVRKTVFPPGNGRTTVTYSAEFKRPSFTTYERGDPVSH